MTANLRGQCIDSGRKRIKEEKTKRRRPYAEFLKRRYREEDSTFRTPRLGQFKNAGENTEWNNSSTGSITPGETAIMNELTNAVLDVYLIAGTPLAVAGAVTAGPEALSAAYVGLMGVAGTPASQWLLSDGNDFLQGALNNSTTPNNTWSNLGFGLWNVTPLAWSALRSVGSDFQSDPTMSPNISPTSMNINVDQVSAPVSDCWDQAYQQFLQGGLWTD